MAKGSRRRPAVERPAELSRRQFLLRSGLWTSASFLAAPRPGWAASSWLDGGPALPSNHSLADRLIPHYREAGPLDAVLRQVEPGLDVFPSEKSAAEIRSVIETWTAALCQSPPAFGALEASLAPDLEASSLTPRERHPLRSGEIEVFRNRFGAAAPFVRASFVEEFRKFAGMFARLETAEFKLTGIALQPGDSGIARTRVRYDLVGPGSGSYRGERVGEWDLEWVSDRAGGWRVRRWQALEETESRVAGPIFVDVGARAFSSCASFRQQLEPGIDHWRTVLDGASRIDVYGNNGIAVGDIDGDGFDDLYVCQPVGLPNRLYRNRGDGTFEDVTAAAGVGVLDNSPCALFADLTNSGRQDLIVVTVDGPLLFLNRGGGRFEHKPAAFRFAQEPQGTFTGAAIADYDGDGLLDVYFCLYSYYLGLNQYQYPLPYYDAENGPPNFLMHNQGDGTFADATAASGMNANNHRYSFTCGWCDFDQDGKPDLYVANDFGRKNLYRNNGNGTFTDVAAEAGVEDVGAGMSVCWLDYDNDGRQDLYVADMWSAAGKRVSGQDVFMKGAPPEVRALLRKHASGNSLFRNAGGGRFEDRSAAAGAQMGRWSWSSDAWDFDHDGYPDVYIANGMISGPDRRELSSFFWRQVVAETPLGANPPARYERGWNAINELIRSDGTWSGYERNNLYLNNRDGTFSEIAGAAGLDFIEDSRAFALADFDHDGRLEVLLKNRSGPQLRLLHNEMRDLGRSIALSLRGRKSNRDAVGTAVTVEAGGLRQTKFVQAGSGFLSQHTKRLYFGLGKAEAPVRALVRWPGGLVQTFEDLPVASIIHIEEGVAEFRIEAFQASQAGLPRGGEGAVYEERGAAGTAALPSVETWLLDPVSAPDISLADLSGRVHQLKDFRGRPLLLSFWAASAEASRPELDLFSRRHARWEAQGLALAAINLDPERDGEAVRKLARDRRYTFLILLSTEETAAVYNILYRYLFDRRRDLGIPSSFLIDSEGWIAKVYQGRLDGARVEADFRQIPKTAAERVAKGLPFPGCLYSGEFHRNQFTYALVFMERGYFDQALASCRLVLDREPENAEARYLEGMIYLKKQMPKEARASFEQTLRLRAAQPDTLPNAWNNLGMLAAQEGRDDEAIEALKKAIGMNPRYTVALQNLGNVYRQQHRWADAQSALDQALATDPDDAEVNYSLAMTFAGQDQTERAERYFDASLRLRPDYPEALNNLGVLYLRTHRVDQAVELFERSIRLAPEFDQAYLNLAKVYAIEGHRDQARATLRELLRRHPSHELAQKLLGELGSD